MDNPRMLRPEELPFPVTRNVAFAINELIDGIENDLEFIDARMDEVEGAARELPDDQDDWVRHYYCRGGWEVGDTDYPR